MEQLDTILPQYFNDLLSWSAIGARTTGKSSSSRITKISMPVGFKNTTNGNIDMYLLMEFKPELKNIVLLGVI